MTTLTKEEYQKFVSAWKYATNAEEAKAKRVVCDHEQYCWDGFGKEERARLEDKGYTVRKYSYVVPNGGHYKDSGWITAAHHIFYNMIRGKNPSYGFYPKMKGKLQYGETPWVAFEQAAWELECVITNMQFNVECIGSGKIPPRHKADAVERFLRPFNGMLKEADLLKINKEELASARKFCRCSVSEVKEVA